MNVALIGLGEVGRVLAEDLADGCSLSAWDTAFAEPDSRAARNARELPVRVATGAADAVQSAELVFSAVTAANDLSAAGDVANGIARGAWFVDLNSASPTQKQDAAALIDAAGGRYVEAAVMSPIHPLRIGSPMLLGGPHASDFVDVARRPGSFRRAVLRAIGRTCGGDQALPVGCGEGPRSIADGVDAHCAHVGRGEAGARLPVELVARRRLDRAGRVHDPALDRTRRASLAKSWWRLRRPSTTPASIPSWQRPRHDVKPGPTAIALP